MTCFRCNHPITGPVVNITLHSYGKKTILGSAHKECYDQVVAWLQEEHSEWEQAVASQRIKVYE